MEGFSEGLGEGVGEGVGWGVESRSGREIDIMSKR